MKKKNEFGLTERELRRILVAKAGVVIKPIKMYFGGDKYSFGVIGDTHLCSKEERLNELKTFYQICQKEDIKDVYHAGDILDGQGVYNGHEYEVHTFGLDNQVNYAVINYPSMQGITTHFITGNHDSIYYKKLGADIGKMLNERRDDLHYLGMYNAEVEITPKIKLRLVHPDKAGAYAISYHAQKFVEQILSGKKPRILVLGHAHTNYHFHYRNILCIGAGCFQGQTGFLLRKGINPVVGGWIIHLTINNKSITHIQTEFIPFYEKGGLK
jgi:predicted phosphodiesterase